MQQLLLAKLVRGHSSRQRANMLRAHDDHWREKKLSKGTKTAGEQNYL